jgi:HK97 family phage major capsid protein
MSCTDLRAQRETLLKEAKFIADSCNVLGRKPNAQERTKFDGLMAQVDGIDVQLRSTSRGRQVQPGQPGGQYRGDSSSAEYRSAFATYLSTGATGELRAMVAGEDTQGGYLTAPQQMVNELIKGLDNAVVIRQLATKFVLTTAESLGVPTLDVDMDDTDWTTELATGNEDTAMRFGKRTLTPHAMAKRVKISNELLRRSGMAEQIVNDRLGYKFAATEENAFMTGNGLGKPLGVFTASTDGISTARDVSTDNTTTAVTADGLINAKFALKEAYMRSPNLRWIFHRDTVKMIRKLKDNNGQYIWQPGLASDKPDTILDIPFIMSEFAPHTFTTGQYVGILGDFSKYWIADAGVLQVQRLVELYAETNQTGFIGRLACDGAPVLEEAFVRVKLA